MRIASDAGSYGGRFQARRRGALKRKDLRPTPGGGLRDGSLLAGFDHAD
jgi:hypothetical protein